MKLIVQIPCYNEEDTLSQTIRDIPKTVEGFDAVEILVIDDGSTDRTVEIAKKSGAHHVIRNISNKGLAQTFNVGLDAALKLGADVIVNTDGDNQYPGKEIPKLVSPILSGSAEIVIGNRQTGTIEHFSASKKTLQKIGSTFVRFLSKTNVTDAVSGFRAYSRSAAMHANIVSRYSYTIETVIHAGRSRISINNVPINTNPPTRESRLIKSIPKFILQQLSTALRVYTMYQPLKVFIYIGILLIIGGLVPSVRFLYYFFKGGAGGHIQSLILSAVLFFAGFQAVALGILADVISFNRKLIEDILVRVKRLELD